MKAETPIAWPKKTREIDDAFMDSTYWDDLAYRDGDVVIATYGKAGTTWVQQIVAQLIFGGEDVHVGELSPWVEFRMFPKAMTLDGLERQTNRRFFKTHLPIDALKFSPRAKYLYVGRDGRDVIWSYHKFHLSFKATPPELVKAMVASGMKVPEDPNPDIRQYYHDWLDRDGYPFHAFFSHIQGWWDVRSLPNVLLVHYNSLKADLAGEIRRIATFLDITPSADVWPTIVEHCTFDYMKRGAERLAPLGAANLEGGKTTFFHKGTNGRWRDVLTAAESRKYEDRAAQRLTPECAHWLATGELP